MLSFTSLYAKRSGKTTAETTCLGECEALHCLFDAVCNNALEYGASCSSYQASSSLQLVFSSKMDGIVMGEDIEDEVFSAIEASDAWNCISEGVLKKTSGDTKYACLLCVCAMLACSFGVCGFLAQRLHLQ